MDSAQLFTQLSLVIALGAGIALIMRLLRQPLIVGHIVTGILAGPGVLNIVQSGGGFNVLSNIGVALLLFVVGLELSVKVISRLSRVVFITTIIQISTVTVAGAAIATLLNFGRVESLVIGLSLAMSSTIVIITLLQEKRQATRLFAQITIGVLLLQDIAATAAKILLSANSEGNSLPARLCFLVEEC